MNDDNFNIKLELSRLENKILELENKQNGVKFNVAILQQSMDKLQQSLEKLLKTLAKNLDLWYANTNTNTEKDENEQTDKSKCH